MQRIPRRSSLYPRTLSEQRETTVGDDGTATIRYQVPGQENWKGTILSRLSKSPSTIATLTVGGELLGELRGAENGQIFNVLGRASANIILQLRRGEPGDIWRVGFEGIRHTSNTILSSAPIQFAGTEQVQTVALIDDVGGAGLKIFGPVEVRQWSSVNIYLDADDGYQFTCEWAADDTFNDITESIQGHTTINANPARGTLDNRAQFFRIQVDHLAGSSFCRVYGSSRSGLVIPFAPQLPELLIVNNVAVGAGATNTQFFNTPYVGPCHIFVSTTAVNWQLFLEALDYTETVVGRIWQTDQAEAGGAVDEEIIHVPLRGVRTRFINNDAGARVYFFAAVPLLGG